MGDPVVRRFGAVVALILAMLATQVPGAPPTRSAPAARSASACPAPATPAAVPAAGSPTPAPDVAATPVAFPGGGGDLTVFAAASLTDAFERIATDLEAANEGLRIEFNFGGSQALVTQLAEGAEADVFASANTTQMTAAQDQGSIAGTPVTFVRNRLTIVVPRDNPGGVASAADLGDDGLDLVLAAADVPVGRYARDSVCLMGGDAATYGDGFVARVAANVVSEEEDVRDVLTRVQLGEADAGIVYVSDVTADVEGQVTEVEIPDAVNVVAAYPIAPVQGGDAALATAFIGYLLGPEGQATLQEYGFESP
ncbi:MAG: Molybdenum ABC transporter, substrate-binding protein ModA [uncultured Thermomicrobiales bacterium]|uniref:Molybdenum ABC transporter, substrate-binding protein ModA n=1 Tax=uncultured Thermomicrobiales bacterium TaxID=1645740 RepID=A0A6J4V4R1_9BACT|nr:MAG: Molybdenum ABC transporter, substrate-binding protein ModA [uncultured Thermomicrobiales bacterium]